MLPYLTLPYRTLRRRPLTMLLIVFLFVAAGLAGVNLWAWHHFRAAEQALRQEDDVDGARHHISQCLRVWQGAETQFLAARIERLSGNFAEAEQHLNECIRRRHGLTEATEVETLLMRAQRENLHEVEAVLWKCLDADHTESLWIAQTLAQIYLRDSRLSSALRCLDRWLERQPRSARAWHWRGWVHEQLPEPEKAIADYEHALEIDPTRWGARLRLANVFLDQYDAGKARPHVDELQRTHPDEPAVQLAVAQCWAMEGEEKKAIEQLDRLLASQPSNFEALRLRGQLSSQVETPAEAEVWLRQALEQRPTDVATLYSLAQCLKKQGKQEEAAPILSRHQRAQIDAMRLAELLNHEVGRSPRNPDLLSEVGSLLLRKGDEEAGLKWLYRALAENPNHTPTHEILAGHFESRRDAPEAEKHRRYLRQLNSSSPALSRGKN